MSFILVTSLASALGIAWTAHKLRQPGPLGGDKVVMIPARTDVPDVVTELQRQDVISDSFLFNVALVVEGKRGKVQAGEYLFKKSETMQGVMDTIVSGRQLLHSITIPEGLTSEEIVQRLTADDVLAGDVDRIPPEGSLFPETYKFVRGASRDRIIREMQKDAGKILQDVWAGRDPATPLKSPFELLTLASIVEKETGLPNERPLIASIFLNRLKRGMRLQSDPTVVYGLVGGKGTLGSGITHAQLVQPTRYNTYLINGLPPGPISNPGRASLEAVAHPTPTNDLYFVADGSGGHVFAATLAEHDKNVQRWREVEKARAATDPLVDHVLPQDAPVSGAGGAALGASAPPPEHKTRAKQRGDAGPLSVYGALPDSMVYGALPGSLATPQAGSPNSNEFARLAKKAPWLDRGEVLAAVGTAADASGALGPSVDSLGLTLDDPDDAGANPQLDGPAPDPTPAEAATASAAAAAADAAPSSPATPPTAYLAPVNGHPRIVDASVGTPLDPLKNTTWDLNYPKVVPTDVN
jgi:UPF0755 protein